MKQSKEPVFPLTTHDKLEVKVPNEIARTIAFQGLPPLAIKLFFYLLAKRKQDGVGHTITFQLQDFFKHSHPYTSHAAMGGDFQNLHIALHNLRYTYVETFGYEEGWRTRSVFNILGGWKLHEKGKVQVTLGPVVVQILNNAECSAGNFTLLNFKDGMKPEDARSLRMYLLACHVQYLLDPTVRTFTVGFLKRIFGLTGEAYANWNSSSKNLKLYIEQVNKRTSMRIQFKPPKKGVKIEELVFESESTDPNGRSKPTSTKRKETHEHQHC